MHNHIFKPWWHCPWELYFWTCWQCSGDCFDWYLASWPSQVFPTSFIILLLLSFFFWIYKYLAKPSLSIRIIVNYCRADNDFPVPVLTAIGNYAYTIRNNLMNQSNRIYDSLWKLCLGIFKLVLLFEGELDGGGISYLRREWEETLQLPEEKKVLTKTILVPQVQFRLNILAKHDVTRFLDNQRDKMIVNFDY